MFSIFLSNDIRGGWGTASEFAKEATLTEAKQYVADTFKRKDAFYPYAPPRYARIYDQDTAKTIERTYGTEWKEKEKKKA